MRNNRRFITRVFAAFCLPALLTVTGIPENLGILRDMAAVHAGESGRTYEEYHSGSTFAGNDEEKTYTEIHIAAEADLIALAENCELDSWSADKYVVLDGDIVLSADFDCVIPGFSGIFEGNGHKISNLQITSDGSETGLFRCVREGARVCNLSVSGRIQPGGSQNRVGILAGVNYGTIRNCSVSGSVSGDGEVGGLVGVNEASGEIRQCSSSASVMGDHKAGGICGENLGTLNNCLNSGNINIYNREVTYDLEDLNRENLENINSMSNIAAHTDTGGIAGYSEGKIYYCSNTGTVGYQHVGYNTGGIVGRLHQGYVQNCTNEGQVYGRKDAGGIVGQMEPFLEMQYLNDKLHEIDRETDRLIELLDRTHENLKQYGGEVSSLAVEVTTSLNNASGAAAYLLGSANYIWYLYNQELTGINADAQRLNGELKSQSESGATKDYVVNPGGSVSGGDSGDVVIKVPDNGEEYRAALRRFGESTSGHISSIVNGTEERNRGIAANLEVLNREALSATENLQKLSVALDAGLGQTGEDVDAVSAQAKVLRKSLIELRDDLFRYEGITITVAGDSDEAGGEPGTSDAGNTGGSEEAIYDTGSFQQGKITLCVNEGRVEADTNVGGIAGQIATEYDFDPEDDITLSGEESFNIEQTIKAVIRESRNNGEILAKKDYAGGIVGKADFGAVISCESYGRVSSSGGSYVGGITGASGYAVRNCYFIGGLSGKNYVGGIAGSGCDIFYSYACVDLEITGECGGSVAGRLADDGVLACNYYVAGNVPGVDSVGYEGGAAPLEYEDFCNREGVPEAFREFSICFVADGEELEKVTYKYDERPDLSRVSAAPPEKEGYYGTWPEFDPESAKGRIVLEAQYIPWVSSLSSEEKHEENGKSLVLVQGQFLPGAGIVLTQTAEGWQLSVRDGDGKGAQAEEYKGNVTVRALAEEPENLVVELQVGGSWTETESTVVGSYLEFQMESPGIFRVTAAQSDNRMAILLTGVVIGAAAVLLIVLAVRAVKKRRNGKGEDHKTGGSTADGSGQEKDGRAGKKIGGSTADEGRREKDGRIGKKVGGSGKKASGGAGGNGNEKSKNESRDF